MQVEIRGDVIKEDVIKNYDGSTIIIYLLKLKVVDRYNIVVTSKRHGTEALEAYFNLLDNDNYMTVYKKLMEDYQEQKQNIK